MLDRLSLIITASKYRLYPNAKQRAQLAVQFGCCRWVWNYALSYRNAAYNERRENISRFALNRMLPVLKDQNAWLKEASAQALQSSILNLCRAFTNFFEKRSSYPKFKKKSGRQSVQYPQRVKVRVGAILLPKLGWVNAVTHRMLSGSIKTVTVSKERSGKYYASVLMDDGIADSPIVDPVRSVVGIDLGLIDLVATSDGLKSGNPRFADKAKSNIRRKQKATSRKKLGSKKRNKARIVLAKAHERVRFQRNDFQHKLSRKLADENQAVIVESLKVVNLIKNKKLARHIGCAAWGEFLLKLSYKVRRRGGHFVRVDRFFPSSKRCSACGADSESLNLSIRAWICVGCGAAHDRDENASRNIRTEGIRQLQAAGWTVSAH